MQSIGTGEPLRRDPPFLRPSTGVPDRPVMWSEVRNGWGTAFPVTVFGRVGFVTGDVGDYSASQITFSPYNANPEINVQDSIEWVMDNALGLITTGNLTEVTSNVLTITGGTGAVIGTGTSLQIKKATTIQDGYLSSADFNTFNSKEPAIAAGTVLQYWRGDKSWQILNSSVVPELTNLYYTDERVDDRVAVLIQNGTGITWVYNDAGNTLTPTVTITQYTDEMAQDTVASLIQNGTGITWSYNDVANTLTPTVTITQYTDEMAQDTVATMIQNGTGVTWSYNDGLGTLTPTVTITQYTDEMSQDATALLIQNGTGITWVYNDGANTLTPTVTITQYTDAMARASISETITGIDYDVASGVFSLTAGYTIPTSALLATYTTGTGTANTLTYWSATSVLTNDTNTLINGTSYLFGYSTLIGSELSGFRKNQNATTRVAVVNSTSGTAAISQLLVSISSTFSSGISLNAISAGFTSTGITVANTGVVTTNMSAGMNIGTSGATQCSIWTNNTEKVRVNSTGEVGIGMTAVNILDITQSTNGAAILKLNNANGGTAAQTQIIASNGTYSSFVQILGTAFTTSGLNQANLTKWNSTSPVGTLFQNNVASTTFWWSIGGVAAANEVMQLSGTGLGILTLGVANVALDVNGGIAVRDITPAQITADQNNYNFGSAANNVFTAVRLSTDASRNITSIALPVQGKILILLNIGSFNIVLTNQDAASTATNRFLFSTGGNMTIAPNGSICVWYDSTTGRWRDLSAR